MAPYAYIAPRIFDGERLLEHHHLLTENGRVVGVFPGIPPEGIPLRAFSEGILSPGFIDVQVNGGGGIMLNDGPSVEVMDRIAEAHRETGGTTALMPTLITDTPEMTRAALEAAAAAGGRPGIIGLHLEGPHLDPRRKGAHKAEYMRPLTDEDVALYTSYAPRVGRLLITLAACQVGPDQIRALTDAGVIVSLGHTEATADEADPLFDAGARGVTHLYNAMSGIAHRDPGLVSAALVRGDVWAGMIADGHHVERRALQLSFAAKKGPARIFLVSDAMALVGTDQDQFTLNDRVIRREKSGFCPRLTLEDGTLAGSDTTLAGCVRYSVDVLGLPVDDALRRATYDPACFLRLEHERGCLQAGARADLVHLSDMLDVQCVLVAPQTE